MGQETKKKLHKIFLWTMIVALSVSALVGATIFALGEFNELTSKLLATTILIGVHSLIGLGFTALYERNKLPFFAVSGLILTVVGFVNSISWVWEIVDGEVGGKILLIIIILGLSALHTALLLLAKPKKAPTRSVMMGTLGMVALVAIFCIVLVIVEGDVGDVFFRIVGVLAIFDGLGSILTPIVKKLTE